MVVAAVVAFEAAVAAVVVAVVAAALAVVVATIATRPRPLFVETFLAIGTELPAGHSVLVN